MIYSLTEALSRTLEGILKLYKLILLTLIISGPQFLSALEIEGLQFSMGSAIILNAEDVSVSPAPSQTASLLGVSLPMKFTDIFYFEPGLRIFAMNVILDPATYKPVPAAIETKDRISVLGCEIRPEFGALFKLNEGLEIGVTGAPVVMLRFPMQAFDGAGDTEKTAVLNYYFSSLRFIDLYVGGFLSWNFSENAALRIKIGTDLPVYHLWDGETIAFYDQMRITPEFALLWRF